MLEVIKTEEELIEFGEKIGQKITAPAVIELIGDVGVGKTTMTKGLAKGLGVLDEITSPSFTLSKRYNFPNGYLVHCDFYRLPDPGIMAENLMENINDEKTIVIIEWADSVANLLPEKHYKFFISLNEKGERIIKDYS